MKRRQLRYLPSYCMGKCCYSRLPKVRSAGTTLEGTKRVPAREQTQPSFRRGRAALSATTPSPRSSAVMFDSTGILEMFCQRISCHHDGSSNATSTAQDCFVVCIFIMERFDWMGGDTVSVSFSMDDGPTQAIEYVLRPQSEDHTPSKSRTEDEMQFYDGSFEGHRSFQGHRRSEVSSATLQPGTTLSCTRKDMLLT